jgi:release factor glutamine methyltransferase
LRPPAPAGGTPIRPVVASGDWTTRRLIRWMGDRFAAAGVEPSRLVAEMLLAHVLECDRMRLYMEADRPADAAELARLRDLVRRAAAGEPVQLLVGTAHFFGRDFLVDGSTLIPQPCTEELVARAIRFLRPERASVFDRFDLQRLDRMVAELQSAGDEAEGEGENDPNAVPPVAGGDAEAGEPTAAAPADAPPVTDAVHAAAPPPGPRVADIGTGSGCVAISIALAVPGARVLATDIADEPLALAARNAERFGVVDRVELVRGDGCAPLAERLAAEGPWDVIVSNPPYIPDAEWNGGQVEASVREHVPERALRGGEDGLAVLRPLLREAPQLLRPGGLLVLECAAAHAERLLEWAGMHPRLTDAELVADEDGQLRTLVARRPEA